ncbi:MAG: 30S ribosomal protein S6 [Patescibacteria group bacterium]|jgi:small subunit ribosomal protein S6
MIYEIMTVIPSKFADNEIETVTGLIAKVIEAGAGKIEKTVNLGKHKMAYNIEHERYGTYMLFYVSAEKEAMAKIDLNLRLSEEVLRHITIARPEGIPTQAYKLVSYVQPLSPEGRRSSEREERPASRDTRKPAEEKKMTTEELSSKLDQILDSDIMKNV